MNNNDKKQQLLIEYLISSADTFALCKSIVKPEYFNPEFRQTVGFINEYYDKYNTTPSTDQIEAETDVKLKTHQVTRDQISYCSNEIEQFCRKKAMEQAIVKSSKLLAEGKDGGIETLIKDAMLVSLNRDLGLDYFSDPLKRLEKMAETPQRTPTLWRDVDSLLNGGLARTEMILFSANSGGGKSIALANLGLNFTQQGLNVLYISLELSEELVGQRFDTMITGVPTVAWQQNYREIATAVKNIGKKTGKLFIKRMNSGTTANQIRAYIKEFELKYGFVPDLLIVDYLDIMGSNESVSADNISEKDKRAAEQLRDIGFDYNMYIATASQQNRSAIEAKELNQGHIAGGLTKVNTVDWYVSIVLSPTMKAAGEIGFVFLKTRSSDGVGKTAYLKWNNNRLLIENLDNKDNEDVDDDGVITQKIQAVKAGKNRPKSVLDLMDMDD